MFSPEFSETAKARSPGSFPEGEVGFPGRGPRRFFSLVMVSSPEKVWKDFPISRKGNGRVSGREKPKSCPWGAMGHKLQIEGELGMMFLHVRRVDGQASNPGQLSPFSLQVARYVRILALSIERHFLLELALPSLFSPSIVSGKCHQKMPNYIWQSAF